MSPSRTSTKKPSTSESFSDFGFFQDDFSIVRDWDDKTAPVSHGKVEEHKTKLPLREIEPGVYGTWCPTCDQSSRAREVHLDADLVHLLQWMWESSNYGSCPIGVTKKRNSNVPDWVLSGRHYGQLRYWGLVLGSAGTYSCLPRCGEFLLGKVSLPETLWVMDDKVVRASAYRIDINAAKGRNRSC